MKKFSKIYNINESLEDQFKEKLTDDYKSLKRGILNLLETNVKNKEELVNVQNFIDSYIKNPEKIVLVGFVDTADIFDFYLKYQADIDTICNDKKYFDQTPTKNNIISLYDFVINGTKFSVLEIFKILLKELF